MPSLFFEQTQKAGRDRCAISITVTRGRGIIAIGESQEMVPLSDTSFRAH